MDAALVQDLVTSCLKHGFQTWKKKITEYYFLRTKSIWKYNFQTKESFWERQLLRNSCQDWNTSFHCPFSENGIDVIQKMFCTGDILTRVANYGIWPHTQNWCPGPVPAGTPGPLQMMLSRQSAPSLDMQEGNRVRMRGSSYSGDFWNGV